MAEANAIGNSEIIAGTTLKVPDVGQNKNDATTFKPYDPSETVGNTSPNLPYMAEPKGCNMLAMAIMIVVALVVTVVTYGAAAPYFSSLFSFGATMATTTGITVAGAVAGGFVAGVAGSIASQVVGKALGVVEHFSLRQAVGSGIAGGLTAGIGVAFGGAEGLSGLIESGKWGKVAAAATLSATSGYVANKIAGVPDTHFSWKSIAVSAVTDFVTKALLGAKPSDAARDGVIQPSTNEGFVGRVATEFGRAMVSRMVRSAAEVVLTGKSVGDNDIGLLLADAFGNALGQAIVGTMEAHKQRKETLGSFTADQTVKYNELVQSGVPKNDAIAYATQAAGPLPDYLLRQQDESSDDAWDYGYDEQNSAESDSEASTGVDVTNGLLGVAIGAGDDAVYVRNAGPNSARAGGNNTAERIATLEAIQVTGQKPAEYLIEQGQEWGRFNFSTDRDTSKFNYAGYILQNEPTTSTGAMIDLNNSARGLSASDISMVSEGYGILSGRMPNKIFDINNPKHFLIEVNLDGTSNHDKKNFDTNVKNLEVLTRDHDRIRTRYIRGVQTNLSEDISLGARAFDLLEGATGFDLRNRVDQAVSFINDQTNKIRGEMPDAVISVVYVGFSRGGLAAREAAYQVDKKGIAVNNSALVLFDSVGSMGLAGDRRDFNFHMAVNPRHQALQIMANDEHRDLFNVTSVYSGIQSFDRNKVEIKLPGAHTDIGGSYPNPYSRVSLSMAHSYMRALGVPMKSLGRQFAPLSPGDNRMALHDSNGFGMQLMSMIRHPQRTRFLGPRDPGAPREIYQSPRYDLPVRVTPRRIEPGELRPVIQYIPTGRRY